MATLRRGRHFFAGPGPTNIPDPVLRAMDRPTIDFNDPEFLAVFDRAVAGLKRILGTSGHVFLYAASGHGAWEGTMLNLFSPGERVLMVESGYFSEAWGLLSAKHGILVETVAADWRRGVEVGAIAERLAADRGQQIRAVCAVHNETLTGVRLPLGEIRAALDAAGHPALLLADTISSLGSMEFAMDAGGIDAVVGGSQKGLMLPAGMSFTAVSAKALAASAKATLPRHYFDWRMMIERRHGGFVGTVPVGFFYGLDEAVRRIEEEGLAAVLARHHRLAEAVRRAVAAWTGNAGPEIFCTDAARRSDSVTTVLLGEGVDAEAVRTVALERFNVGLGSGLGRLNGRVFRIGHLGDLNEPMVLGTLGAVEMALGLAGVPHARGGVAAAMEWLARGEAGDNSS
ncbi:MAG: pyridoxal-phosphate-dependent aminotransferase family protein [Acetobacteraceae bacterium]